MHILIVPVAYPLDHWLESCTELAGRAGIELTVFTAAVSARGRDLCARRRPQVPVTLFAAQNVAARYPFPSPVLERHAYRRISCAFPITPAAELVLRAKGYRGRSHVVPLGVDTEMFTPRPAHKPRPFTVGFVGWLERHKGVLDLLAAAERIDADLLLVGKDRLQADIQRETAHRAGRVFIEAMACGVPVVGSDVGEIPHVIGDAGLVYLAGDVTALAQRLALLRDNAGLAAHLSAAGRVRAREFSWSRIGDAMCRVWDELAGETPVGVPATTHATAPRPNGDQG